VSKNATLIEQVGQLMEANLTDTNLSSKLLADGLGLSVNYLRNLYKSETNLSTTHNS
jgi:AraC-like DNA-binding protein